MNAAMFKDVLVTWGTGWRHCLQRNLELIQGLMETPSVLVSGSHLSPSQNRAHSDCLAARSASVSVDDIPVFTRVISSTPVRCSLGPTSQGLPSSVRTPVSARRMSALPTPASRRLSGLPLMAPQSLPRALASPLCLPARRLSSEPRRRSTVRAEPTQESSGSGQGRGLSSDESSSPPSSVPQALDFSPEKNDFPPSHGSTAVTAQGEAETQENTSPSKDLLLDIKLDQLTITPEAGGRDLSDHPLIDFSNTPESNMALGPSSWPLMDLIMNTPNMARNNVGKPPKAELGQLIDLDSPLIQLSPLADKENVDSPLLKF